MCIFKYITALRTYPKKLAFTTRCQAHSPQLHVEKHGTVPRLLHDVRPELGGLRLLQCTRGFRRAALRQCHVRQHRYDAWKCTHTVTGPLTLWRLEVSACTVRFNTKRFCPSTSQCIHCPHIVLTINSHYFPTQHSAADVSNGSTLRSLWGTNGIITYQWWPARRPSGGALYETIYEIALN